MTPITDIIAKQYELLTQLKTVIEAEKAALIDQDADRLLALANEKSQLLNEIISGDEGLSNHPDKALLTSQADLISQVDDSKQLLEQCKQLNALNTSLIEHSMASISRFSQALQVSRNASSLTYDGKGRTSTISSLGSNLKV
ncbi:flagellar protein FlgN [Shewanella sp. Isolate11]|uniref:flagella synthesis protein FlgN n=1 Tax=Shewanella sp. Isolate11 TaxID=2908530 RepID=UPI001EFEB293|nr:flagellar protein FlgN [Shewanella sp. Isolate11]MCG9697179.1 flagellar protein FlgN [Shewanella sp. Isolate11]